MSVWECGWSMKDWRVWMSWRTRAVSRDGVVGGIVFCCSCGLLKSCGWVVEKVSGWLGLLRVKTFRWYEATIDKYIYICENAI